MQTTIDLRSDTVTRPSQAMRRAMVDAEVGDDVFDDDPTVHVLQVKSAELLGKEAGLFLPTGTMANAAAIKSHTQAGDEILLDGRAHSMLYEVGLPATIAHVITRQFLSYNGVPDVENIVDLVQEETLHSPGTSLLVLENTHNRAGGSIIPLDVHHRLYDAMQNRGIPVHLDGARLFNASVAVGVPISEFAAYADSVTFCLSKGLGCPVGSVLCGSAKFVERAKRVRKMLGGGMRQAGILAAAGVFALDHNIDRLADDHANARRLAEGIDGTPGIVLDTIEPPTNMVYFTTRMPAEVFAGSLEQLGIRPNVTANYRIRLVTHLDVSAADIERAIIAICQVGRQLT